MYYKNERCINTLTFTFNLLAVFSDTMLLGIDCLTVMTIGAEELKVHMN